MQKAKRYAIIVGIVVGVLLIIGIILAAIFNAWLDILYIALIITATFTLIAVAFQIYAVLMLVRSITTVRDEMKPLIASVQQTVGIVQETARTTEQTVSTIGSTAQLTREFAVKPTVRVVAGLVAARQVLSVLISGRRAESQRERRRIQQMEAIEAANATANAGAGGGE
jgi:O-antigen/teichoic acid export membrane protein